MAIYHFNVRNVKQGKNLAVSKFQYITRAATYKRQPDPCLYAVSGNLPEWAKNDPEFFWKTVDEKERKGGRLAKDMTIALPLELSEKQQIELVQNICEKICKNKLPYTAAIHAGAGENPHAHIIMHEREISPGHDRDKSPEAFFKQAKKDGTGGARKDQTLDKKNGLFKARKDVEDLINSALEKAQKTARVSAGRTACPYGSEVLTTRKSWAEKRREKREKQRAEFEAMKKRREDLRKKLALQNARIEQLKTGPEKLKTCIDEMLKVAPLNGPLLVCKILQDIVEIFRDMAHKAKLQEAQEVKQSLQREQTEQERIFSKIKADAERKKKKNTGAKPVALNIKPTQ